jgi:UDPglucose 6-dehydrogenase
VNVSVIGLGKLGLCTAACIASKGHNVVGVDKNESAVESLKAGRCTIRESGLPELLESVSGRMSFSSDADDAIQCSDVTLIIVPTPSDLSGVFVNDYVTSVLLDIAPALARKKDFHVVDVVSTVMPGSSEKIFIPMLEKSTSKKCGVDFGFVYNPEFIALGSVIHDFLNPDFVLIGASDEKSGEMARTLYESFVDSTPHFAVMSPINAEITKLALNCYITMKITYANELSRLCGVVEGADVDIVTSALGADARIGGRCLKGGLGFAGPCFPRDNIAFQKFAENAGVELFLSPQVVRSNDYIVDYLFHVVASRVEIGSTIAMLGFAYKSGTHITERSQSLALMDRFLKAGYRVSAHDPMAAVEIEPAYRDLMMVYDDPVEAVLSSVGVLLLTPWQVYIDMDWDLLEQKLTNPIYFFDCWRSLKNISSAKVIYWSFGRC